MINEIVNHIKARLGAHIRKLELSDEALIRCLQTETLMTLSIYNSFYCEYVLDTQADIVPNTSNTFYIPEEIEGFRILGVEKVYPSFQNFMHNGMLFAVLGQDITNVMSNFVNIKLSANVASAFLPPETFQFIPPNHLRLYNQYGNRNMVLTLKTTHKKDFTTFHYGLRETIMKLALADVSIDLLGIRRYFQNLSTTFAEINLDLDILQQYADKRDDIIESMRKNILKNTGIKKIYIA